jgi:hypothetical protein
MAKGTIRNICGTIILLGHLLAVAVILAKWRSMSNLISVGAPILPILSYAFVNVIRYAMKNEVSDDDARPALFLFSLASMLLTTSVIVGNLAVILMIDSNILGTSVSVTQGREIITCSKRLLELVMLSLSKACSLQHGQNEVRLRLVVLEAVCEIHKICSLHQTSRKRGFLREANLTASCKFSHGLYKFCTISDQSVTAAR